MVNNPNNRTTVQRAFWELCVFPFVGLGISVLFIGHILVKDSPQTSYETFVMCGVLPLLNVAALIIFFLGVRAIRKSLCHGQPSDIDEP